jgi:hypothetical protein
LEILERYEEFSVILWFEIKGDLICNIRIWFIYVRIQEVIWTESDLGPHNF